MLSVENYGRGLQKGTNKSRNIQSAAGVLCEKYKEATLVLHKKGEDMGQPAGVNRAEARLHST